MIDQINIMINYQLLWQNVRPIEVEYLKTLSPKIEELLTQLKDYTVLSIQYIETKIDNKGFEIKVFYVTFKIMES